MSRRLGGENDKAVLCNKYLQGFSFFLSETMQLLTRKVLLSFGYVLTFELIEKCVELRREKCFASFFKTSRLLEYQFILISEFSVLEA